eukprot:s2035_g5.t1
MRCIALLSLAQRYNRHPFKKERATLSPGIGIGKQESHDAAAQKIRLDSMQVEPSFFRQFAFDMREMRLATARGRSRVVA